MSIKRLPRNVFTSILSSSSMYSQESVVKELLENSIDALHDTTNAQIYLEIDALTAGLEYLLVKDNGTGVGKADRTLMCLNCTTSKLTSMDDLERGLQTCGFRGEALYFVSHLAAKMRVLSRTENDDICETWEVNKQGIPSSIPEKQAGPVGTTITLRGLFRDSPVRRKFLKKHSSNTLHKIQDLLLAYSLIHRNIRFQLRPVSVASNGKVSSFGSDIIFVSKIPRIQLMCNELKLRSKDCLFEISEKVEVKNSTGESLYTVMLHGILPKMRAQDEIVSKRSIRVLTVNDRPLSLKLKFGRAISRIVNQAYIDNLLLAPPVWYINIVVPPARMDVNIEPSKSDVMISNEELLLGDLGQAIFSRVGREHQSTEESMWPMSPLSSRGKEQEGVTDSAVELPPTPETSASMQSRRKEHVAEHNRISVDISSSSETNELPLDEGEVDSPALAEEVFQPQVLVEEVPHSDAPEGDQFISPDDLQIVSSSPLPTTQSTLPFTPSLLPLVRIPAVTEMGQHTLGQQTRTSFCPTRNDSLRKRVLQDETSWVKRTENPSLMIKAGFVELYEKLEGKRIDPSLLNIGLNEDGIFEIL